MEREIIKQKFYEFSTYISRDISLLPENLREGIKIFFGYNAVYGIREIDSEGNIKIHTLSGSISSLYRRDYNLYKEKLAKTDIFEMNMLKIMKESVPRKKWVWRIQDLGYEQEDFLETAYGKKAKESDLGYRAVIVPRQPLGKYFHSISVYKYISQGDFTELELELFEWIANVFGIMFGLYLKYTESAAVLKLVDSRLTGMGKTVGILNSNMDVLFKTAGFDGLSKRILGKEKLVDFLLPILGDVDKIPAGLIHKRLLIAAGQEYLLSVSLFAPETELSTNDNKLILVEISPQDWMAPEEREPERLSEAQIQRYGFTKRECEVLELLLRNASIDKISEQLYTAKTTVRTHISHIYRKMGVNSRLDAMEKLRGDSPS